MKLKHTRLPLVRSDQEKCFKKNKNATAELQDVVGNIVNSSEKKSASLKKVLRLMVRE